jgi:parallel beta-helix repeat protein
VTIDTSGGLSDAAIINKRLHLIIDGEMKASFSAIQANPPFILNITEPGVTLSGTGRIIGDGTINDLNAGTDETIPGLIRVAADNFTMSGIEVVSPPKVGILLYQCFRARIDGVRFTGGPTEYSDTAHFAIRANGGGGHIFNGNRFYPDVKGGMFVQCIVLVGSNDNIISANTTLRPYEKLIYGFGDRNIASANVVVGNDGVIPGTNRTGTITNVIRFHGSDNKIDGNTTSYCAGGAQIMDGSGNEVTNNKFLLCGQTAISLYRANLTNSKVRNNLCTYGALPGFVTGDGIRLAANAGPSKRLSIDDNTVIGFSIDDPIANLANWKRRTAYPKLSLVKPSTGNGRYYMPQATGGISGAAEPKWPATPGATVVDGTITWVAAAYEGRQAEIKIEGGGGGFGIAESSITNNKTSGGCYGLVINHVTYSKIALNKFNASLWGMVENNGSNNRWEFNDVIGTTNISVENLNSSSTFLNYFKGEYTPSAGDGLVVKGTLTLSGRWEQLGRKIKVTVQLDAAGILIPDSGSKKLCTLPKGAAQAGLGKHWNYSLTSPGTTLVIPSVDGGVTLFASPIEVSGALPNGPSTIVADVEYEIA